MAGAESYGFAASRDGGAGRRLDPEIVPRGYYRKPMDMKLSIALLLSFVTCCVVCGGACPAHAAPAVGRPDELALPPIPDTLREPRLRAGYLLEHFWDAMEFADTLRSRDRDFMEQNFVNFAGLFPHADTAVLPRAVEILMRRAEAEPGAYRLLAEIAEKYLGDPASPMACEAYFILFLERIVEGAVFDAYERLRPAYLLESARKNRPGATAADFAFVTPAGERRTLHGLRAERLVLLFYDPGCDHCREVVGMLRRDDVIRRSVRAGRLTLLALCADGDRAAWERSTGEFPPDWIVGFDTGSIAEEELYVLPSMPTLYLLDRDKRVLLKEASPQALPRGARRSGGSIDAAGSEESSSGSVAFPGADSRSLFASVPSYRIAGSVTTMAISCDTGAMRRSICIMLQCFSCVRRMASPTRTCSFRSPHATS